MSEDAPTKPAPCKECRELKKYLRGLIECVEAHLEFMDEAMKGPSTEARGRKIARMSNALEMAKDQAKFFGLKIDHRTGKPRKPTVKKAGGSPR